MDCIVLDLIVWYHGMQLLFMKLYVLSLYVALSYRFQTSCATHYLETSIVNDNIVLDLSVRYREEQLLFMKRVKSNTITTLIAFFEIVFFKSLSRNEFRRWLPRTCSHCFISCNAICFDEMFKIYNSIVLDRIFPKLCVQPIICQRVSPITSSNLFSLFDILKCNLFWQNLQDL